MEVTRTFQEVARALATHPELLLLDELMAGLNPTEVAQAMELVTRIRDKELTILLIEQNVRHTLEMVDRAYVLENGQRS